MNYGKSGTCKKEIHILETTSVEYIKEAEEYINGDNSTMKEKHRSAVYPGIVKS